MTWRFFVTLWVNPAAEHVTVTGQDPGVVRVPTFHVQLAFPEPSAVVGPNPAAVDGPDLYSTTMLQFAPAAV